MEVEKFNVPSQKPQRSLFSSGPIAAPAKEEFMAPGEATPKPAKVKPRKAKSQDEIAMELADKANAALGGGQENSVNKSDEELAAVTEDELKLAQELIFKGYAEMTVERKSLGVSYTVVSTSAVDLDMVNEILHDYVSSFKVADKDEEYNITAIQIDSYRNSVMLALAVKSVNGIDICDDNPVAKLDVIKPALKKINRLLSSGDFEQAEKNKDGIKKSIKYRAAVISEMPSPIVDLLSSLKAEFDSRMILVLNKEGVIPKY